MSANRRQGLLAIAKQTAIGSPASSPTYVLPMSTGGGPKPLRDISDLPITRPSSARAGQYVQRARGEGAVTVLAHEEEIGLLLLAAMGSEQFATVSGVPHHRFTMTEDLDVALSVWVMLADDWWFFPDSFVTLLNLSGASGENCLANVGLTSWHYVPHVPAPAGAADLTAPDEPRFKYIGSEVFVAPIGRTPTGPFTDVESVELEIRRNPTWRYGTQLTPSSGVPIREIDLSMGFTYNPDELDWDLVEVSATGSLTGSHALTGQGETQDLGNGSARVRFGRHPSSTDHYLEFYSGPPVGATPDAGGADTAPFSENWQFVAERPDPDPAGGPIDIAAAGRLFDPQDAPGESEVTLVLAGGKTSAY